MTFAVVSYLLGYPAPLLLLILSVQGLGAFDSVPTWHVIVDGVSQSVCCIIGCHRKHTSQKQVLFFFFSGMAFQTKAEI